MICLCVIASLFLRLLIKSAVLMPSAKDGEVTVVQVEAEGYNKQKVNISRVILIVLH